MLWLRQNIFKHSESNAARSTFPVMPLIQTRPDTSRLPHPVWVVLVAVCLVIGLLLQVGVPYSIALTWQRRSDLFEGFVREVELSGGSVSGHSKFWVSAERITIGDGSDPAELQDLLEFGMAGKIKILDLSNTEVSQSEFESLPISNWTFADEIIFPNPTP